MMLRALLFLLLLVAGLFMATQSSVPDGAELVRTPAAVSFTRSEESMRGSRSEYVDVFDEQGRRFRFNNWLPGYDALVEGLDGDALWQLDYRPRDNTVYGATSDGRVVFDVDAAIAARRADSLKYRIGGAVVAAVALWQLVALLRRRRAVATG